MKITEIITENKKHRKTKGIQVMSLDDFASQGQDLEEADLFGAPAKSWDDKDVSDYLQKTVDKEKTKGDRFKIPYVHRSSALKFYDSKGKKFDLDKMKSTISQRPDKILKKNEKMEHSSGEKEQFFNVGFAALTGLALDERTNEFKIVNTCPGAGSCKIDCFARGGGKIQFEGPWISDARLLTWILNDPKSFEEQLKKEIAAANKRYNKDGIKVSIRWHDSGDFFSPEYVDMAINIAKAFPTTDFYAYTKIADVALASLPKNFQINWSEGAHTSQEKKIKMFDPRLEKVKHSRIVPTKLTDGTPIFSDLLKKDAEGKLIKSPEGAWVITDMPKLKQRLADLYKIPVHSILDYDEMMAKSEGNEKKWNVIIAPGQGDISAKRADVLGTLLLKH